MKGIIVAAVLLLSTGAGALTFDANVPADIQKQMSRDLDFVDSIRSNRTSPLHQQIFGNANGTEYTHFFQSRVTSVGVNSCGLNSKAVACVIPRLNASKMWITNNFIAFSHPQIARLMVLFHEARHTEVAKLNWSHATCPAPFKDSNGADMKSMWTGAALAGEPACDVTPYGSYGSSLIMLKNISKYCTTCTSKVKMDAGIYADDQLKRIIDARARSMIRGDLYTTARWSSWPIFAW